MERLISTDGKNQFSGQFANKCENGDSKFLNCREKTIFFFNFLKIINGQNKILIGLDKLNTIDMKLTLTCQVLEVMR